MWKLRGGGTFQAEGSIHVKTRSWGIPRAAKPPASRGDKEAPENHRPLLTLVFPDRVLDFCPRSAPFPYPGPRLLLASCLHWETDLLPTPHWRLGFCSQKGWSPGTSRLAWIWDLVQLPHLIHLPSLTSSGYFSATSHLGLYDFSCPALLLFEVSPILLSDLLAQGTGLASPWLSSGWFTAAPPAQLWQAHWERLETKRPAGSCSGPVESGPRAGLA